MEESFFFDNYLAIWQIMTTFTFLKESMFRDEDGK